MCEFGAEDDLGRTIIWGLTKVPLKLHFLRLEARNPGREAQRVVAHAPHAGSPDLIPLEALRCTWLPRLR